MKYNISIPEGTRDRLYAECRERRQVQGALTALFRRRGYAEVSTPEVEFYDMFLQSGSPLPQESMLKVIDRSGDEGNYLESSVSTMFIYTLYKGVRLGLIDPTYLAVAEKGYQGVLKHFIEVDENGVVSLTQTCAVAGLGGNPYRSGDYDYYIHEKVRANDPKAVGPFINASLERERLKEKR